MHAVVDSPGLSKAVVEGERDSVIDTRISSV